MKAVEETILKLLEHDINPALSSHGGRAELAMIKLSGDAWEITLRFSGGCLGCPESEGATLRSIEFFFREELSAPNLIVKNGGEISG